MCIATSPIFHMSVAVSTVTGPLICQTYHLPDRPHTHPTIAPFCCMFSMDNSINGDFYEMMTTTTTMNYLIYHTFSLFILFALFTCPIFIRSSSASFCWRIRRRIVTLFSFVPDLTSTVKDALEKKRWRWRQEKIKYCFYRSCRCLLCPWGEVPKKWKMAAADGPRKKVKTATLLPR